MAVKIWSKRFLAGTFAVLFIGYGFGQNAGQNKDEKALVKNFEDRIARYLELRKSEGISPKPSSSADKLAAEHHEAAQKIRQSRPAAKQGDFFTAPAGDYFKKQIAATLQGPDGARVRASLRRAEPLPNVELKVNEKYPPQFPLQSTPPSLLLNLPHLPGELQYRIVGRTLVLYDVGSKLIVDFLPEAFPAS